MTTPTKTYWYKGKAVSKQVFDAYIEFDRQVYGNAFYAENPTTGQVAYINPLWVRHQTPSNRTAHDSN